MLLSSTLFKLCKKATEHVEAIVHVRHGILTDFTWKGLYRTRGEYKLYCRKGFNLQYKSFTESQWDVKYGSVIEFSCLVKLYRSVAPNDLVRDCMNSVFGKFGFHRFNQDLWAVN